MIRAGGPDGDKTKRSDNDEDERRINLISGFTAGALTTLMLHPLDLIKTRLQITHKSGTTTAEMFKRVLRHESWRGLYSGLTPNFTGASISWGLYFYLYSSFKQQQQSENVSYIRSSNNSSRYLVHLVAAVKAGAITACLTNPIWLVKTRMCTQGTEIKYTGILNAFRTIAREEGLRALYKGLIPALFGVSHGAVQFLVYEELKRYVGSSYDDPEFKSLQYVSMAVFSKSVATVATYPYQTIKSRLQTHVEKFISVRQVVSMTMKQEGVRGFYRGLGTNLIRVVPGTMSTFLIYEFCMHTLTPPSNHKTSLQGNAARTEFDADN